MCARVLRTLLLTDKYCRSKKATGGLWDGTFQGGVYKNTFVYFRGDTKIEKGDPIEAQIGKVGWEI
jgi:hypothetical protein